MVDDLFELRARQLGRQDMRDDSDGVEPRFDLDRRARIFLRSEFDRGHDAFDELALVAGLQRKQPLVGLQ